MQKKVIITLSTIVLIAVGVIFLIPNSTQKDSEVLEELNESTFFELPEMEEENLSKLSIIDNLDVNESNFTINSVILEVEKMEKTDNSITLYEEVDNDELLKKIPQKHGISPKLAIKMDKHHISNLNVGDTIKLPNIGQVSYEAVITKRITHKNGSVSVTGNLKGSQNEKYSVIFTEGKKTSYASFTTPEGAFEVETIDGIGYIYSVQDIENRLIDPNKEDLVIPPK